MWVYGHLIITIQSSGAQKRFDYPVYIINTINSELNPICPLLELFGLAIFSTLAGKRLIKFS